MTKLPSQAKKSFLSNPWCWLSDVKHQKTLALLGGGLVVIVSGFWQVYTYLSGSGTFSPKPAQEITAADGGIAAGGDVTADVIQTGPGTLNYYSGISEERFQELSEELGVTKAALKSFFKILERNAVPPEDLDSTLRTIAKHYKELNENLATFTSDDPEVNNLKAQTREAIDLGDFERADALLMQAEAIEWGDFEHAAEALLTQAKEKGFQAMRQVQETGNQQLRYAAPSVLASALNTQGCLRLQHSAEQPLVKSKNLEYGDISEPEKEQIISIIKELENDLDYTLSPTVVFDAVDAIQAAPACPAEAGSGVIYIDADILHDISQSSEHALNLVLAHELAHILQFSTSKRFAKQVCDNNIQGITIKTIELLADMVSGHLMYTQFEINNPSELLLVISKLSDYRFSDVNHHGTANERMNAFSLGYTLAFNNLPIKMKKFLANQDVFLDVLGGPPAQLRSPRQVHDFYTTAMKELYK